MSDLREAGGLSTGEILDRRYILRERIGEGGMARVYRADDEALGRTVAIKVMRSIDSIGSVERVRSETTLLAALNHHGLVTLYDARISDDDLSYLVMEYVDGITLRERIAQGPIPAPELASIAVDLAEALHVAHTSGIVHRDIKPSNVLLWRSPLPGREWRAKLADFGIAHLLDSARITTPGTIIGTVAYVAPEQARGDAPAPPADIYALGLLLMESLTGERAFADAEGIGAVMARLAAPPEVPRSVEPEWRGLLRGMTAMRPEDRPSALEVAITAERLALGGPPLPAALADHPTQVFPAPAAIAETPARPVLDTGATALMPAPFEVAEAPTRRRTGIDRSADRDEVAGREHRRRTMLIAVIVAGLLVIAGATAALWWSTQSATGETPGPVPTIADTPAPQPSDAPADDPAPSEEGTPVDDGGGGDGGPGNSGPGNDNGNNNGSGNGNGNDNRGPGNNNGNGNGNGNG